MLSIFPHSLHLQELLLTSHPISLLYLFPPFHYPHVIIHMHKQLKLPAFPSLASPVREIKTIQIILLILLVLPNEMIMTIFLNPTVDPLIGHLTGVPFLLGIPYLGTLPQCPLATQTTSWAPFFIYLFKLSILFHRIYLPLCPVTIQITLILYITIRDTNYLSPLIFLLIMDNYNLIHTIRLLQWNARGLNSKKGDLAQISHQYDIITIQIQPRLLFLFFRF